MDLSSFDDITHAKKVTIKGRTKRVSTRMGDHVLTLLDSYAIECIQTSNVLYVLWDGDDIVDTSFSGIMKRCVTDEFPSLKDLISRNQLKFCFATSTTSPYPPKHFPGGVEDLVKVMGEDSVFALRGGSSDSVPSRLLFECIIDKNTRINEELRKNIHVGEFGHEFLSCVENLFGNGNVGFQLSEDGNFPTDQYCTYGYLLLGISYSQLMSPDHVIFMGMGATCVAESIWLKNNLPTCEQVCITGGSLENASVSFY